MFVRGFKDYLVSQIQTSGLENPVLIKSYIRRVLSTGYGTYNLIKCLKGSRTPCARISNIKSRKNRREHRYRKLEKMGRKEERIPKNRQDLLRLSVRQIHVRKFVLLLIIIATIFDKITERQPPIFFNLITRQISPLNILHQEAPQTQGLMYVSAFH